MSYWITLIGGGVVILGMGIILLAVHLWIELMDERREEFRELLRRNNEI